MADEIHHDFVFPGHEHAEFAPLNKEMQENCIVCTAPSKTFNIAGLGLSNIFIPNSGLRTAFQEEMDSAGLDIINLVSMEACKAAYAYGADWLEQLLVYIKGKRGLCTELSCRQPSPDCHDASGRHLPGLVGFLRAWHDTGRTERFPSEQSQNLAEQRRNFRYKRRGAYAAEYRLSKKCAETGNGTVESCTG